MKQLVLNADDFGWDAAVNAAVAQAHTGGLLTSASLMITAPAAEEAITFAKAHPRLGVGLHLCLVQGRAALTEATGKLPDSPVALSARLRFDRRFGSVVEAELREQLRQFLATGLRPTHLDSHMHTHADPRVLEIVIRLARENNIAFVRAPAEPIGASLRCDGAGCLRKVARAPIFRMLGGRARQRLRQNGLRTADRAIGVLNPGQLNEQFLERYLALVPEGVTEILFHPAAGASPALERMQRGYGHAAELQALCSPRLRRQIDEAGMVLTNFGELACPVR